MSSRVFAQRAPERSTLGDRIRQLRIARGLTQTELGAGRFTKAYISQLERGRARPSAKTLEWLAEQLGVAARFLETGVSSSEHERAAAVLVQAEAALESHRYRDVISMLDGIAAGLAGRFPELELRALVAEASARMELGEIRDAIALLDHARGIAEAPSFRDLDRADVLFRLGCCRYKLSSLATAVALLSEALALTVRSGLSGDRLRSRILRWRSRCYRRQRDWEAAREDVERALELAERLNDRHALAHGYFQASLIAERKGHWVLARSHAERAKALYEEFSDRVNVGRLLNNLGGLSFLLGKPDEAIAYLKDAFAVALEVEDETDAARAVSSLAQVHLRTGEVALAEEQARHALKLLDGRVDFLDEIGNAQLVLGRALLEEDRLDEADEMFRTAEASFEQLSSVSHRAAAWIAQGDVAARRGDHERAERLFRHAAETLQDFRF